MNLVDLLAIVPFYISLILEVSVWVEKTLKNKLGLVCIVEL